MFNKKFFTLLLPLSFLLATCGVVLVSSPTQVNAEPIAGQTQESIAAAASMVQALAYPIVDTGQNTCYDNSTVIDCPAAGEAFYGQDAQFTGASFDFTDNGDGTVTDNVTGLTWEQTPNSGHSSWPEAQDYCAALSLGGQDDWRMPSLKELFSISNFSVGWPYLDTTYFDLAVNDSISKDEQYWSSNYYVGTTVEGRYDAAFGVNHATGHIKAYPALVTGPMGKYVRCVYGDEYLINDFVDNGDGTITDAATGLMWMQSDSGAGMDWEAALAYAQEMNEANYLGYSDWRLPNVKELQSIVDYSYAPDAQDAAYDGPALDPLFTVSEITNEAGDLDYPYFWTSTSARFQATGDFYYAWYVAAGRAVDGTGNDSHGAGAVRFDVKVEGGPAGEGGERVYNYVRLVRDTETEQVLDGSNVVNLPLISNLATDSGNDDTGEVDAVSYPIVDTNQGLCFNNSEQIDCPAEGEAFYGQDAQYTGNEPSYTDNGDGTITDNVTGLVWTQDLSDASMPWSDAAGYCESLTVGSVTDWRLPNIKELWSIRDFSTGWPWVDTDYFYLVGDGSQGAQQHSWSSNYYLVDTEEAVKNVAFIVNDWTGHIKALDGNRFVRCVSGDEYGINDFVDNGNGTISDNATDLMWAQNDSGEAMNWEAALAYAEASTYAGYDDWRLPNVKELQSIADYSGVFPAIDSTMFNVTGITNEADNADYPYYWSSTSNPYIDPNDVDGYWYAWYVAAGYAVDHEGNDTHGAGAVRFDTKTVDAPSGPDAERGENYVRLVRGGDVVETPDGDPSTYRTDRVVVFEDGDTGDIGAAGDPGGPQGGAGEAQAPDFAAAAAQLGVTEDELIAALGDPSQGPPDFEAAAAVLGVTVEALETALMSSSAAPADASQSAEQPADASSNQAPPAGNQQGGPGGQPLIDLTSAAAQLGVTEEALQTALGGPNQGPPDFAAAATELGVTEAALIEALGLSAGMRPMGAPGNGQQPAGGQPPAGRP